MREQRKSDTYRYGEPPNHRQGMFDVISIINADSNFAVVTDFGIKFTTDGRPDYHEYDIGILDITSEMFLTIGRVIKLLMDDQKLTLNDMYDKVEIFRKFIDKHVKMIVEIDGERHRSMEVRIRDGYTQGRAVGRWGKNGLKFVRINKDDTMYPEHVRKKLWFHPTNVPK